MGHSYFEGRGKTLRFRDSAIELSVYLIDGTLKKIGTEDPELPELIASWREIVSIYAPGCMLFNLDPYLNGSVQKSLVELLKATESWVLSFQGKIPKDLINGLEGTDAFVLADIDPELPLGVIRPIIALLSEKEP